MAYGIKYRFLLNSVNGVEYSVNILQDGYTGSPVVRPLGRAPILKKSSNGCIRSTTLELTAECRIDGEYAELYTSNPGEFLAALFRNNVQIWSGSLVTEVFSAPEIAPPYDVQIVANDGIAEAKLHDFVAQGAISLRAMFQYLLSDAPGGARGIDAVCRISGDTLAPLDFFGTALINLDYKEGETKYDVLTYLLDTLHATITSHGGNWLIVRETDVEISGTALPVLRFPSRGGSASSTTIAGASMTAGQMGVAQMWPVGHLSTNVVPAKRKISVEAAWHLKSGLPSLPDGLWTVGGNGAEYLPAQRGYMLPAYRTYGYTNVYADVALRKFTRNLKLTILAAAYTFDILAPSRIRIYVVYTPNGGTPMYLKNGRWASERDYLQEIDVPDGYERSTASEFSFDINNPDDQTGGTLRINVDGRGVDLYDAGLYVALGAGYKDVISINNGARGIGDTAQIAGSRVGADDVVSDAFLQGIFLHPGNTAILEFSDRMFSGLTFMSLQALGLAASVALPRIELSGTLDFPASAAGIPLVVNYRGVNYWVESYELDVREENLKVTAVSLPAVELSVESEVITELESGSVSSPSGMAPSGTAVSTVVNAILTRDNIVGLIADQSVIIGLYADRAVCDEYGNEIATTYMKASDNFFELDGAGGVKLKDDYIGLWAKGWMSGGGKGSDGSGGGGSVVSVDQVLAAGTHIATITVDGVATKIYAPSGGTGSVVSWGSTAGYESPLTVEGESKTVLLSGALTGYATEAWVNQQGFLTSYNEQYRGTVTSVTLKSGTGITVSNSGAAITGSGSRTISISSEYQTNIGKGVTAYGWGDHSLAGYATQAWVQGRGYLTSHQDLSSYALKTGAWTYNFQVNSLILSGGKLTGPSPISGTHRLNYTYIEGGMSVDDPVTTVTKTVAYLDDITHQTIYGLTLSAGAFSAGAYTPNSAAASFNIPTTLDHISDGTTRKLANYLPLTGGTMTGAITMSGTGANIVPATDDVNYLGASDKRFHAGFIRDLYLSYLRFVDGTTRAERGTFSMGDGYAQVSLSGTNAENYMFYAANGFFKQGGGVPLGRSDHRWSCVYSVDGNFSGGISIGGDIVPSADLGSSLGYSTRRFFNVNAQTVSAKEVNFKATDNSVTTGYLSFQSGYMIIRAGTNIANSYKQLTFHESFGFYPETSGVNLGYSGTNYRWANIYGVNADLTGDLALAQTSHIDIGPLRIEYDSTNKALHITKKDSTDTETYGLYTDGLLAGGGPQQAS